MRRARRQSTVQTILLLAVVAKPALADFRRLTMKAGKRNQLRDGLTQQLWGELVGIDNRTDQERTFTVYTLGGSILIVNDKGHERLAGPDNGLNKYEIFREVMAQFQVHSLRVKPPVDRELIIEG